QLDIQVGAHDGEKISINLRKIDSTELGLGSFSVSGVTGALSTLTDTSTPGQTTTLELDMSAVTTIAGEGATVHGVDAAANDGTYSDYVIRTANGKQYQGSVAADGAGTFADASITDGTT